MKEQIEQLKDASRETSVLSKRVEEQLGALFLGAQKPDDDILKIALEKNDRDYMRTAIDLSRALELNKGFFELNLALNEAICKQLNNFAELAAGYDKGIDQLLKIARSQPDGEEKQEVVDLFENGREEFFNNFILEWHAAERLARKLD